MNETAGLEVKVYIDIVLLINFVMDFFILWATAKIANLPLKITRLIWGAILGALYSLVVLFPEWPFLTSFLVKCACSIVMVWVAYRPKAVGKFIRALAYLYIISFAMGGAVVAAVYLTDTTPGFLQVWNGVGMLWGIHFGWLMVGLVVAFFLGYGGYTRLRKNWLQQQLLYTLTINIDNQTAVVLAFLDTGNQLTDPATKKPVIVIETAALKKLIPAEILRKIDQDNLDINELLPSLEQDWVSRLRLIPFNSVGSAHSLMIGFRPDTVIINSKGHSLTTSEVILGLVNKSLSREGQYQALLNPQILEN
jgi:stage II sporulation protein GA (sporulation sigma-E factor processing peptidase)